MERGHERRGSQHKTVVAINPLVWFDSLRDTEDFLSFFLFFLLIFIGVELIYNVVLISGVQQSESVIHIPTLF